MNPRPIEQWTEIFSRLDATTVSAEQAIANRILGDLSGYRINSQHRARDNMDLANALQAYARLVQEAGLKV